ncbi:hypothetical protein AM228_17055 [Planktothricoides sp. SR001]|uniref:hypothetical protein n=1 Tax=Planktothricoides sp. SR001 TaxID=1705388 RepID=UPI0006C1FC6F|nr:hypothetical protein [Planktothricoides sp. SR001]KOR35631.1 hypothetical protein AM228_17055 [Planktothricoides sp. SR001]
MESKVFKQGNYIWECKSSHHSSGEIDLNYLKTAIKSVETRWEREGKPSGYYYVFPVNLITNTTRQELERFKQAYQGEVDINYYDREQVQKLIQNLSKLSDMKSLVDYIKQVWKV